MTEHKICRNCKYYQGNWDISDKCMHPDARKILITDGSTYQQPCSWVRSDKNKCGPDAIWFETYTGNRDWDNFVGFIGAVAFTVLLVELITYGPMFISKFLFGTW